MAQKPSPSGRGWGAGATPSVNQRCITPARPTVIPAKAGIHTPALSTRPGLPGFWIPACTGIQVGAGITAGTADGCPMMAQALKSPPFAKGGLGGFSPRLIPTKGRIQPGALVRGFNRRDSASPTRLRVDAAFRELGRGGNPPTPPLLRKGGFLGLAPTPGPRPSFPPPLPTVIPAQAGIQSPG